MKPPLTEVGAITGNKKSVGTDTQAINEFYKEAKRQKELDKWGYENAWVAPYTKANTICYSAATLGLK